jgi:hypothetical protein
MRALIMATSRRRCPAEEAVKTASVPTPPFPVPHLSHIAAVASSEAEAQGCDDSRNPATEQYD